MVAFTTWAPWDKYENNGATPYIIGSDGLTLTVPPDDDYSAGGRYVEIRGIDGQSTGKFYSEYTLSVLGPGEAVVGIANNGSLNAFSHYVADCAVRPGITTEIQAAPSTRIFVNLGPMVAGMIIGMAVDLDAKLIWFRSTNGNWNGDASASPSAEVGGVSIAGTSMIVGSPYFYPFAIGEKPGHQIIANFGQSSFHYSVPSGFFPGWPVNPLVPTSYSTWDTVTSNHVNIDSSSRLTAALNGCVGFSGALANTGLSTGKYYFEGTYHELPPFGTAFFWFGLARDDIVLNDSSGPMCTKSGGSIVVAGNGTGVTFPGYAEGQLIGIAVDLINQSIWFRVNNSPWNNNALADPSANVGGIDISSIMASGHTYKPYIASSFWGCIEANFGPTFGSSIVPDGFVPGWIARDLSLVKLYDMESPTSVFAITNDDNADFPDSFHQVSLSVWLCKAVDIRSRTAGIVMQFRPAHATIVVQDSTGNLLFSGSFSNPATMPKDEYHVALSLDTETQTYTFRGNGVAWTPTVTWGSPGEIVP